ncbi:MAG: ABC-F family ATP-binding cassette domain-containing protein [Firmicutes bacterium]|nr:ABC-F family ATP-binding cassette domain-containing protein [Bacillota bacterium]
MSVISVSKLNKSYSVTPVLTDVSFHINEKDRIGIVGANGAGKSTLIRILTGELDCDSGEIFRSKDITVGYLKQRDHFPSGGTVEEEMRKIFAWQTKAEVQLAEMAEKIENLHSGDGTLTQEQLNMLERYEQLQNEFRDRKGYTYKSEIRGILNSLAFSEDFLSKPVELLSGGERTRLALAALLLQEPDLLFLDEPTNHLDIGTLKWLEDYLQGYKGTLVIISHDRYFLDKTVKRIFEIENCRLSVYEGNYTKYKEKKQQLYEERLRHYENEMAEIHRQEEMIRRFKEHNTEHLVKRAQSREKRLAMIERPEKPVMLSETLKINFTEKLQSGNDVIFAEGISKSFTDENGTRKLFEGVSLDIKKGDRICLVGPNGVGKTTLLRILLGDLSADSGLLRLGQNVIPGYYDQEQKSLNPANTVLEELHSVYFKYDATDLRKILGSFLFKGDDVFKQVADLAGGEKARLSLLKLMMSGANLLIFDEPTNHLDIAAKEIFEDALLHFPGTILIVSHDRYLLQKIPTAIYELGPEGISVFLGGYDYYSEKRASLGSGKAYLSQMVKVSEGNLIPAAKPSEAPKGQTKEERAAARLQDKKNQAEQRKREKQKAETEKAIADTEERIARLEADLCEPSVYNDLKKSKETSDALEDAKARLDELYAVWMEFEEG